MKGDVKRQLDRLRRVRRHYESRRRKLEQTVHAHRTRLREIDVQMAELETRAMQERHSPRMDTHSAGRLKLHHRHREYLRARADRLKHDQQRTMSRFVIEREAMVQIARQSRLLQNRIDDLEACRRRKQQRVVQDTIDAHARIQRQKEGTAH